MGRLREYGARLLLLFTSLILACLLSEGALSAYRIAKYGQVGRAELMAIRKNTREDVVGGRGDPVESRLVLHPLFGYTYNPRDEGINNFGFHTPYDIGLG